MVALAHAYRHTIAADGKIRTHDQVLRLITAPRSDQYPYALKPAGWTRETDPFQAEALARLGAAGDTFEDVPMFEEVTA
jgi:hypothetical protein